jgi:hypothetical protein
MSEEPFVRDPYGTIIGFEVHDYIWLFDKEAGWTLCLKNDVRNPAKCSEPPDGYDIPSDEQNNEHSIIFPADIMWDDTRKTPVFYNVPEYREIFKDSRVEKRSCYFYFGNPDPSGNDYPKKTFSEEQIAFLKENKKIFVLKIVNRNGPVWGPIKYRPEHGLQQPLSTRDAGLEVYGRPKVSIFAKHRRGGNRSLRKRYRKRRQTLRRTRR